MTCLLYPFAEIKYILICSLDFRVLLFPVYKCFRSVIGVLTVCPKSNSNGVKPILSSGVSLTANIRGVIHLDQSYDLSDTTFFSKFLTVLFIFSQSPFPIEW